MKTTLAALPYYWSKTEVLDFYAQAALSPVDVIYLGETVCSKRHQLRWQDWQSLGRDLRAAGKQVVLSSLILLESSADWRQLEKLCANNEFMVEANDVGAIQLCAQQGQAFVSGAGINCYNAATIRRFAALGCQRVVLPFDLNRTALSALLAQVADLKIEFELQVYGPLALAYSARCFTARHYDLSKDDCQFRCQEHAQGLKLFSREQQQFLTINGIQTQSGEAINLLDQIAELHTIGISHARFVPDSVHSLSALSDATILGNKGCNGFWFGEAGMRTV